MIHNFTSPMILLAVAFSLFSAPQKGESFEFRQPDGSLVPVNVWGDEFYQRVETPDGFTLVRNPQTGWICYADISADSSEFIPTDRIYRPDQLSADTGHHLQKHLRQHRKAHLREHAAKRALLLGGADSGGLSADAAGLLPVSSGSAGIQPLSSGKKVTGNYTGLTILIDFSDQASTVPIDSIEDLVNKRGYTGYKNNGSVRDYYYDVSGGKVDYQNIVVGYYRAAKAKTYYDNASASFGVRAQELIIEALKWLDTEGFDFTQLTTDAKKRILAVNFMYAGTPSQGWSEGLWPHQGNLTGFSADGVSVRKYQITYIGSKLTIGAFCHENGHMLFSWPDLYDYGGESAGVGAYCIMCATDEKNPVPPCAYLRNFSGWDVVTDITAALQGTTFSCLSNSNLSFTYKSTSNTNEMFFIESRRCVGRSKMLPDSGFLIWHIDRTGSNDNQAGTASSHYLVSIEQADNKLELEKGVNNGKAGDLFRGGYKDRFDDNTSPNAHWWNGTASGMKIYSMSNVADTMSFSIGEVSGTTYAVTAAAGAHGSISPSGTITVPAGSDLTLIVKPDSGYQVDALTIDGQPATLTDEATGSLKLEKIGAQKAVSAAFALKSAIGIVAPADGTVLYAGDTVIVSWRSRGVTVQGFNVSYTTDGGKTYIALRSGMAASDSVVTWVVPGITSDSCKIKVADIDGTPSSVGGFFSITTKPSISLGTALLTISVEQGKIQQQALQIGNTGIGQLRIKATTAQQMKKVLINELSIGADSDAPDAMELWNGGADIDLSGWELVWEDNRATSGSYQFPEGYIFRSGTTFLLHDNDSLAEANSAFTGNPLQWNFSDSLVMAVTLVDASGRGVDFVKSKGSADLPPEGTSWAGNGVELANAFVYRIGSADTDSASDWTCGTAGTLAKVNVSQHTAAAPAVTLTPLSASVEGAASGTCTIKVDATNLPVGSYLDTIVIYHNDPAIASPIRIPCMVTVTLQAAVKNPQRTVYRKSTNASTPAFAAAPNPAAPGENVVFRYAPVGDEEQGKIMIHNAIGTVIYSSEVDFSKVSCLHKNPVVFSWDGTGKNGVRFRQQTCLARLVIVTNTGVRETFTLKVGLK